MTEIEIGRGKRGRRAYSFDDIAIVPSRRTRDPEEVSIGWQIDAYHFDLPFVAAPMDSVMSPETAIAFGKAGGLGVLDLEGLWTRYEDPRPLLAEIADLGADDVTPRMREIYAKSISELEQGLSGDLRDELERLTLPFDAQSVPSDAELRVAQAQLVGWLEGLFHGIQTAIMAQQMAAQAQLQQLQHALPPGARPGPGRGQDPAHGTLPGTGQYL